MSEEGGSSGGHGGPVWLLTYCDLITLLVAFFVMMISFSSINVNKYKEDMPKIEESFAGGESILEGGKRPVENLFDKDLNVLEGPETEEQPIESQLTPQEMYNYISGFLQESGLKKLIDIEDIKIGCKIKIPVDLCFDKGEPLLKRESYTILDKLGIILRILRGKIVIDANVGKAIKQVGESTKEIDLSISRAANICDFLVTKEDIEPQKIALSGYRVAEAEENMITIMIFKK